MSNSIIEVTNLSKSHTISHEPVPRQSGGRESYTSLRDVMAQKAKKIFSFFGAKQKALLPEKHTK